MEKRRFSLVELMVVICIISLLSALLLPALKKAKDKADQLTCTGNQKQFNCAVTMYVQDYNGYFHMCYSNVGSSYWDQVLVDVGYLNDFEVFRCATRQKLRDSADTNPSDFIPNYRVFKPLLVPGALNFLRITEIKSPSNTIEVLDSQVDPLPRGLGCWDTTNATSASRIGYLHSNSANVVFVDGHTASFRFGDLRDSHFHIDE